MLTLEQANPHFAEGRTSERLGSHARVGEVISLAGGPKALPPSPLPVAASPETQETQATSVLKTFIGYVALYNLETFRDWDSFPVAFLHLTGCKEEGRKPAQETDEAPCPCEGSPLWHRQTWNTRQTREGSDREGQAGKVVTVLAGPPRQRPAARRLPPPTGLPAPGVQRVGGAVAQGGSQVAAGEGRGRQRQPCQPLQGALAASWAQRKNLSDQGLGGGGHMPRQIGCFCSAFPGAVYVQVILNTNLLNPERQNSAPLCALLPQDPSLEEEGKPRYLPESCCCWPKQTPRCLGGRRGREKCE